MSPFHRPPAAPRSPFKPGDRVRVYVRNDLHLTTNGRYGTVIAIRDRWHVVRLDRDKLPSRHYTAAQLELAPPEAAA